MQFEGNQDSGSRTRSFSTRWTLSPREREAVLGRISSLMEFWGITLEDLQGETSGPSDVPKMPRGAIKYRHPSTGEVWDGDGAHPDWLRRALLKEGFRLDELRP
jgi:DNA-binding protein H-NS